MRDAGEERGRRMHIGSNLRTRRVYYTTTRGNVGASVADEPPVVTAERTNHAGQQDVIDVRLELRLKETNGLQLDKHSCTEP